MTFNRDWEPTSVSAAGPSTATMDPEPEPEVVASPTADFPVAAAEPEPEVKKEDSPAPIAFPTSSEPEPESAPVAFPSSADDEITEQQPPAAPIAFPASDEPETSSQAPTTDAPGGAASPGITFAPETAQDRERSPSDPDEPKRKRISSQNFQRLARRISVSARRTGSGNIPGIAGIVGALRRDGSTPGKETPPRDSTDDTASATGSTSVSPRPATPVRIASTDSPAASVHSETPAGEGKKLKKEKKERRKTLGTGK